MTATTDPREETFAERRRLATLLAELTPGQWAADSLCTGWRVREVVAHMTMPYRSTKLQLLAGVVRSGLSFSRYADRAAHANTRMLSDTELLASYRDNETNPWRPPGGGTVGALSHEVIHGLDITEPLDLPAAPPSRMALVLQSTGARSLKHFGVALNGRRLVATDTDTAIGSGSEIPLPTKEILLIITGRQGMPT